MSNEIKLSKATIDILKNFSDIHQSIKIVKGNELKIMSSDETVIGVCKIEESFPRDVHIYDLREFISAVSLMENPVLVFTDEGVIPVCITIKNEKSTSHLRYIEADPVTIKSYLDGEVVLEDSDIESFLSKDQIDKVLKASNILKLPYIGFRSDGKKVELVAFERDNGDGEEANNFSIDLDSGNGTPFNMFLDSKSFGKLLDGDYDVKISSKQISCFSNHEFDLQIFMTLNVDSVYGDSE